MGHSSTHDLTKHLLNDCEILDAQPFTLEHNHDSEESSDMSTDEPDDKSDETRESGSSDEEDDIRDSDSQEQDDPDLDLEATLGEDVTSGQIIDNKLVDKMDEYGYTGLNQVLDSDGDAEASGEEDTMDVEAVEHNARL